MANAFLNEQVYANVMLLLLKNQLVMGRLVDGQFKNEVSDENGLTVNIKRPPRFIDKKDGTAALAAQDVVVGSAPITVDQYSKVHVSIGDIEYVQSYNQLMQNATMRSAASTLAHSIDSYLIGLSKRFHSQVMGGTPAVNAVVYANDTDGTNYVQSAAQAQAAHTRLMEMGVPDNDLSGILTYLDGQYITGQMQTNFTPNLNEPALLRNRIPMISSINWFATQQVPVITTGTRTQGNGSSNGGQIDDNSGDPQNVNYSDVKGAAGSTSYMQQTLRIDGMSTNTVKAGEIFTIQGVYAYDWRMGQALDYLQQFTVLEDAVGVGGVIAALKISPAIIVPGIGGGGDSGAAQSVKDTNSAFATVDSVPADGAYIQFLGAASTKIRIRPVFHKRGISMVSTRLQTPFTGVSSFAVDPDTGIAVRYWRGSDITTGAHVHRWDAMYGGAVLDPFLGTRIGGQDPDA